MSPPPYDSVPIHQLFASRGGKPVIARLSIVLRRAPKGGDPGAIFQAVERRIERPVLYLENVFRAVLDGVSDGMPVSRSGYESLQDEQVERALQHLALQRIGIADGHADSLLP